MAEKVTTPTGGVPKSGTRTTTTSTSHADEVSTDVAAGVNAAIGEKLVLRESDCYDQLGFSWPTWKKWWVLTVIFWVQVSMNFNTSLYSNGLNGISEEFGVSLQAARCGAMIVSTRAST